MVQNSAMQELAICDAGVVHLSTFRVRKSCKTYVTQLANHTAECFINAGPQDSSWAPAHGSTDKELTAFEAWQQCVIGHAVHLHGYLV